MLVLIMVGNILKYIFWKYLKGIVSRSPMVFINAFSGVLAYFQFYLRRHRRTVTAYELVASGLADDKNVNQLTRRSFNIQFKSWVKKCFLSKINPDNVVDYLDIEGAEHLDKAESHGKGAVLLNPHFGPFLFVMPAIGHRGYTLNQVALQGEPIIGKRRGMERLVYEAAFDAVENNMPVKFINTARSKMALRDAIAALGNNEFVLFASTGRGGTLWHEVEFLGRKATFSLLPFKIALKSGSAILPVFVLNSNPIAKIVIEEPLAVLPEDGAEQLLVKYVDLLSEYAGKYPDHLAYFLYDMHVKRWWDDHPFFSDYPEVM